jgi:HK97 family phage major capsid protein
MSLHIRERMLAGAAAIPQDVERKDADPGALGSEIKKSFDEFTRTFEAFKTKNDERLAQIEKKGAEDAVTGAEVKKVNDALTELKANINIELAKLKRPKVAGEEKLTDEQIEYKSAFELMFRTGKGEQKGSNEYDALRALEKKALAVASDTDGGFTVTPTMETQIDATLKQVSPIRSFARVVQIGTASYKSLVNQHGTASGWVGEQDARPQTQGPQLLQLEFPVMEVYAMPAATQSLLDDASVNIEQWLADEVSLEFAQKEGAAFVSGDGNKKPWGILGYTTVANASYAWGKVGYVATGASGAYASGTPADSLIDLFHALKSPYRANSTFLMNNTTLGATRKLKDGQGNYLVNSRLTIAGDAGAIEVMMGKPVVETPDMPDPAANSLSVAYGDFMRGYLIVDRVGIRVLRDPYSAKPYVLFYTTKRVGGGIRNFEAIKLLKFAAS